MGRLSCPVRGCDRPSWLGFAEGRFPACRCERLLVRVLLLLVVLVGFVFGGISQARADFWSDLLDGQCGEGEEYRGYHRVNASTCARCGDDDNAWYTSRSGGRACVNCAACRTASGAVGGGFYRRCAGEDGFPVPACVDDPATPDEESDTERHGDILDALAGGGGLGSLFGGSPGGVNPAVGLFGDDIGAVQDDDLVPQVGSDADGYSCPDGTRVVEEGEDAGLCRVSDRCIFYGAASGTYPDCVCAGQRAPGHPLGALSWDWDPYSLRCVPGNAQNPGSALAPDLWDSTGGDSTLFNLVCGRDYTANSRGGYSIDDYLSQSSPVFVARRGGIEVARYGSTASLTIQLGRSDWSLSSGEEDDEEDFGNVLCSWVRGPLRSIEGAISGFTLSRLNTGCPTIDVPVFSSVAQVDLHCYIVGRWLGLIQAAFIVGYSFLGVRWFLRYG